MSFISRTKFLILSVFLLALNLTQEAQSAENQNEYDSQLKVSEKVFADKIVAKPYGASSMNAKLENATEGLAHLTLAPSSPEQKAQEISLKPNTKITLNGAFATVSDLKPGDSLELINDSDGKVTEVKAIRTICAIVLNSNKNNLKCTTDYLDKLSFTVGDDTSVMVNGLPASLAALKSGDQATVVASQTGMAKTITVVRNTLLESFWDNFRTNLFKPLLLFFYLGFAIALLKIAFEFPQPVYQGLTIYLLLAIGWNGGEELAALSGSTMAQAITFMVIGFITNAVVTVAAYFILRAIIPKMRRIDSATVAAFYGSDSAGTFVTCLGVLQAAHIAFAAYMPVMLAVMELPGCLVGLYIVSKLRKGYMDAHGNMPGEYGYDADAIPDSSPESATITNHAASIDANAHQHTGRLTAMAVKELVGAGVGSAGAGGAGIANEIGVVNPVAPGLASSGTSAHPSSLSRRSDDANLTPPGFRTRRRDGMPLSASQLSHDDPNPTLVLREVFLNPGIALLFGGIIIGFLSRSQGYTVAQPSDQLFVNLFQGMLCLFLLEMGMTAARRLQDLRNVNWRFVLFGLLAPNVFAIVGMCIASLFSHVVNQPLQLGTYVLFAVLCGSASYIALPAIQRLAIPESSPTLPLAASLGLTFSYNVTIGIPIYLMIAQELLKTFPVSA